jgi:chemosensory pili system protein ChpA (sensor histidine kinase/response regulator)
VLSLLNELLAISGQIMEALAPGESWPAKRAWLVGRMLHVADGLGLLAASALRQRLLDEIALLGATPATGDPPAGGWGQVAERLHVIGADLLTAAGMEPAAAVAENTAGMPTSGHIARRLEADLVHAERVIERLEQDRVGSPAEPADGEVEAGSLLRNRLEAMAGAVRAAVETPARAPVDDSAEGLEEPPPQLALEHGLLDDIAHIAGDIDGARSRLEQQVGAFREGLQDMDGNIRALREDLEGLRMQTETLRMPHDPADPGQVPAHVGQPAVFADIRHRLERLSSGLGAIAELRDTIESIAGDSRSALVEQARENVALEQRLMQSRMQPLDGLLDGLGHELSERAADAGKQVVLHLDAGGLLIEPEKMAALLPVLRSLTTDMIATGVEPPRARVLAGHPPGCRMDLRSRRRGADLEMILSAECRAPAEATLAGARASLRPLGGSLELATTDRFETRLRLRMPLAPRVTTVLLVAVAREILALPLAEVSAVVQLSVEALEAGEDEGIEHDGQRWQLGRLADLLALGEETPPPAARRLPLVLVASGDVRQALMVDAIGERVDVVVRSIAPQLRSLRGLAGAAILGDGQVVLMLDVGELMESRSRDTAADLETLI